MADYSVYASNCLPIGKLRMRFPVAAKIALIKAAANDGTPGSPTPLALEVDAERLPELSTCLYGSSFLFSTSVIPKLSLTARAPAWVPGATVSAAATYQRPLSRASQWPTVNHKGGFRAEPRSPGMSRLAHARTAG
jgi:hypothetical protein